MIDIREYYLNDDGENRPGKKGKPFIHMLPIEV